MSIVRSAFPLSGVIGMGFCAAMEVWAAGPDPGINVTVTNPASNPVPVTGTLSVGGSVTINNPTTAPVPVQGVVGAIPLLPTNAFSIPPTQPSLAASGSSSQKPDPSGTRYAISSITVTNTTTGAGLITFRAYGSQLAIGGTCAGVVNAVSHSDGPVIWVPANATVHIAFPQPFITEPATGPNVCMTAGGFGFESSTWSMVGYKILP